MPDLTDAIAAAHAALDERFYPGPTEEMVAAAIEAAAPVIEAQIREQVAADLRAEGAERALREAEQRIQQAAFKVDSTHQVRGLVCLCGFRGSARTRAQTEHITTAVITEFCALEAGRS